MINYLKSLFDKNKRKSNIRFVCSQGGFYVASPVELARNIMPEWLKEHFRRAKEAKANSKDGKRNEAACVKFVRCPGMHDYVQSGYIITAPADIHIKANKFGVNVAMPSISIPTLQATAMDYALVEGWAPIQEGLKKAVWKVPLPWGIMMPEGHSAHVMPAYAHGGLWLDKLFSYPGTVDYDKFHTVNFIFTVMKECDFIIPQGTPLLQILPFKRTDYHGHSGPGTQIERDRHLFGFATRVAGAYRRRFHTKKIYTHEVVK